MPPGPYLWSRWVDRFDHPAIGYDDGLTSVAGAVAWLECPVVDHIPAGDHHIALAAPVRGGHCGRDQRRPLLYHDRRYTSLTEPKEETKPGEASPDGAETVGIVPSHAKAGSSPVDQFL
ncbi:hypothetical protein GCM10010372_75780 [Streptomyces tauricus]|uniref:flavin reductase family protein n=1 Tax=Streptomyces tauricus TaxID=68274 RepID=UPI001986DD3B|nr:hypothetical protein GCM10010372_75780 [Streptomyces tauricus]